LEQASSSNLNISRKFRSKRSLVDRMVIFSQSVAKRVLDSLKNSAPVRVAHIWLDVLRNRKGVYDDVLSGRFRYGLHARGFYATSVSLLLGTLLLLRLSPDIKWSEWWWQVNDSYDKAHQGAGRTVMPDESKRFLVLFGFLEKGQTKAQQNEVATALIRERRNPGSTELSAKIRAKAGADSALRVASYLRDKDPQLATSLESFASPESRFRTYMKWAYAPLMLAYFYVCAVLSWWAFRNRGKTIGQTFRILILIQGFWVPVLVIILFLQRLMVALPATSLQWVYTWSVIGLEFVIATLSFYHGYKAFSYTHGVGIRRFTGGFHLSNAGGMVITTLGYYALRSVSSFSVFGIA
jgi:hypothetical protein